MPARIAALWTLQALFAARVLGQVYVGLYEPGWLPGWKEWYSGLLPYPLLFLIQILVLCWMTVVSVDNTRGSGRFAVESVRVRRRLKWIALAYGAAMFLRYAITMASTPEMRWFHGTIPIVFHLVLASYIGALAAPVKR